MTHEIIQSALRLADALAAENAALAAMDLAAAAQLLDEKLAATEAFTAAQRRRPTLTADMMGVAARLRDLAEENRRLLERAIAVQKRVLGTLASAARANDPAPRYGRRGAFAARPTSAWALSSQA